MPTQTINSAEFESLINDNEIVFIDFWAEWCAPCKQFSKVYEQVSDQFPAIKFVKVNIEEQQELADFSRSDPSLILWFSKTVLLFILMLEAYPSPL